MEGVGCEVDLTERTSERTVHKPCSCSLSHLQDPRRCGYIGDIELDGPGEEVMQSLGPHLQSLCLEKPWEKITHEHPPEGVEGTWAVFLRSDETLHKLKLRRGSGVLPGGVLEMWGE